MKCSLTLARLLVYVGLGGRTTVVLHEKGGAKT